MFCTIVIRSFHVFILKLNVFEFKPRSMISTIAVTGTATVAARARAGPGTRATAAMAAAIGATVAAD